MSKSKISLSVLDKMWLTKEEAMSYLNRGEKTFDDEIRHRVNIYKGAGRQEVYKRSELDYVQSKLMLHKIDIYHEKELQELG